MKVTVIQLYLMYMERTSKVRKGTGGVENQRINRDQPEYREECWRPEGTCNDSGESPLPNTGLKNSIIRTIT